MSEPMEIEDVPTPELDNLQQRDMPVPAVPVRVEGTVLTQRLPNRIGAVSVEALSATRGTPALRADPRRASAILMLATVDAAGGATKLLVARSITGQYATWPLNVPLPVTHCDDVFAKVDTGTGTLTVLTESYAD